MEKVALITGGSSGIGLEMARELAKRKYPLLLVSNQPKELETCQAEIQKLFSVPCYTFCIDLTNTNSAQDVFDYCRSKNLHIEILINNAGFLIFSEIVETPIEKLTSILQLHINTPAMLCRLFGEEMKKNRNGFILNVSSIATVMPYPGISLYGPTKTFLRSFTRSLRHEMKIYGVGVTCLIPGATATALYDPNKVNIPLAMKLGIMKLPDYVARAAIRSLFNKEAECIPGGLNKFIVWFLPLVPSWLIYLIHRKTKLVD